MYLHNAPTTVNGKEEDQIPWIDCKPNGDRMDGSRYYEFFKTFINKRTHHITINDWRDTPHGGFWIAIVDIQNDKPNGMAFECSEWIEVCIILRSLA